jgi:flagellar biogenesis protein FliO
MSPLARYVLQTVLTLAAVAGLAVLILYAARRVGVGRPSGPLSIVGRLVLDARRVIYLVRVGEQVYVIGASEAGLSKLGEIAPEALGTSLEVNADGSAPGFRQLLERLRTTSGGSEQRGPGDNP